MHKGQRWFEQCVMVYDYLLVIRTKSLFPYIPIFSPLFLAHDTSVHKVTELVSFWTQRIVHTITITLICDG